MPRRAESTTRASTWLPLLLLGAAVLLSLADALPAHGAHDDDDEAGPRPLLEFTKGGIRINIGGYHAQAGLGGLLTGDSKDGFLHASAGTPTGAHASAGLGGTLADGGTGGLQARAGLGNGGPEAAAGLGGTLQGRPRGELYAESSRGNFPAINIQKTKGKNIQQIAPNKKPVEQVSDAESLVEAPTLNKKVKSVPSTSSSANANGSAATSSNDGEDQVKSQHPARWYFEKRLRERYGTKSPNDNAIVATADEPPAAEAPTAQPERPRAADKPDKRQSKPWAAYAGTADSAPPAGAAQPGFEAGIYRYKNKNGALFDDIFNIPISALKAVNQLLKNHVGKK